MLPEKIHITAHQQNRIILLVPSTSYKGAAFANAAQKIGINTTFVCDHRQTLEDLSGGASFSIPFEDFDKSYEKIFEFSKRYPFGFIYAIDDYGQELAAYLSEKFNLPRNPLVGIQTVKNKLKFRSLQKKIKLNTPDVFPKDYPAIIKPISGSASHGVVRVNNRNEESCARAEIKKFYGGEILKEKYIEGLEHAVEGAVIRGQFKLYAVFDKPEPLEGPYFEETIYLTPTQLSETQQIKIILKIDQMVKALKLRQGPIHAEVRLNHDGIWILDFATRTIGGKCSQVLKFSNQMSLEEVTLRQILGETPSHEVENDPSGVMMIPVPKKGILRKVNGINKAKAVLGIENVVINIPLGGEVIPLPEGKIYLGFIFCRGKTRDQVYKSLHKAHSSLDFAIS
jgi:hypothetical protein